MSATMPSSAAATVPTAPRREPRYIEINRKQLCLETLDIEMLVDSHHDVRAIWAMVEHLDVSAFESQAKAVTGEVGRAAWNPRVLIALWIYAYRDGEHSAREIERLCDYHPAYRWLTARQQVNYHTLAEFRTRHKDALNDLFAQVLGQLHAAGLVDLEMITVDGTKIRAHAGCGTFRRQKTIDEQLAAAREQVEQLSNPATAEAASARVKAARQRVAEERATRLAAAAAEVARQQQQAKPKEEARVSITDPEARVMRHSDGAYRPSYNMQLATDGKQRVILDVAVTQSAADVAALQPAVANVTKTCGVAPKSALVDGGYMSDDNIVAMDRAGVTLYAPLPTEAQNRAKRKGQMPEYYAERFTYDETQNHCVCPGGNILIAYSVERHDAGISYRYTAAWTVCRACPHMEHCCPGNKSYGRSVVRVVRTAVAKEFQARMESAAGKEIYRRRGEVAEFPNAWVKDKIGLRQFSLVGRTKVQMEALWVCMTYNIQQWIRLVWRPQLVGLVSG
jgi:transposase